MNKENISSEEIVFLKFINGKNIDTKFSSRWKFQYNINPDIEIEKLLNLKYIIYKNKYILTEKAIEILNKNKKLFMSDREKAGKEFEELTDREYNQLQVFHKVNEYKRLKHNELSFEKGYTKNDILWSIYNMQKDIYIKQKDYDMLGVVYNNMYDILKQQEKYEQQIHFLICCMFFKVYKMLPDDGIIGDIDYYERHMKNYCKTIKRLMKSCNKDIEEFKIENDFVTNDIKRILEHYVPKTLLQFDKINKFQQKINKFLNT